MSNKKGEKLISVYWFAILVIVATGIVLMVNSFYGKTYDVRDVESKILADKVADCIYFGGKVNSLLLTPQGVFREDFRDRFMELCSLNFDVKGEFTPTPYYVEVQFFSFGDLRVMFETSVGNNNFKPDCNSKVENAEKLAKCNENQFYMKTNSNKIYLVKILSIVGKTDENTF
ncbi:hypothetical protein COU58_01830 [Candidatus Pacearchaeota archaeon CG10_big_fil_rev_8_21_14_0_10_32_42]|nr:MAG: hypothetical protein COU58_01830 [Candidatus Pacearchaeota archaeon CG10_big_fil_rev_8_21_14_0_10_32_42]